jgi:hypothetical protein
MQLPSRTLWAVIIVVGSGAVGCGDDDPPLQCGELVTELSTEGITISGGCARLALRPLVRIDGVFHGGGDDGTCEVDGSELRCPAGGAGEVFASVSGSRLEIGFEATTACEVEVLALEGTGRLPGAASWLSNGFQSWSQSGVIALGDRPTDGETFAALALRGDPETLRTGEELSNWYTFIGSPRGPDVVIGALSTERLRPWVQAARIERDDVWVRIASGGAGEHVALEPGETLNGESFHVAIGDDLADMLTSYAAVLPTRRTGAPVDPEVGWNSWYELWDSVDETAVRENAEIARVLLEPFVGSDVPLRIVVDDGWQRRWGEWEPNDKFPSGMDGLASDLASDGFEMGVWLAPLLVEEESSLVGEHPDWFVEDAAFEHIVHGSMRILDVTHPDAAAHLAAVISQIVGWGYGLLKIDFLFAGSYEGIRHEQVTGMEAYHTALAIIRAAAGEDTVLLAVGAPPLPSFPYVDGWRLGGDIAFDPIGPSWYFAVNQARSLAARWPLCHAALCDPDPLLLREMSRDEVDFAGWVVALAGSGLFLSDDLRLLPQERRTWGLDETRVRAMMSGTPSVPIDLVPEDPPHDLTNQMLDLITGENSHVLPTRWTTPAGETVVLNLTDDVLQTDGDDIPPRGARVIR